MYDIAAENGGGLSILNDFYVDVLKNNKDGYKWFFLLSKVKLIETKNIKVIYVPWIKKSWFHRIFFDLFIARKYIKKYKINEILSLQNNIIPFLKIKQILYFHNSLPFSQYRFRIYENIIFWFYQNIITYVYFFSFLNSNFTVLQANWIRELLIKRKFIRIDNSIVISPVIKHNVTNYFNYKYDNFSTFFYPASPVFFKNHRLIVDACLILSAKKIHYKIFFTLLGDENNHIKKLKKRIDFHKLNIYFIGNLNREEVFKYYSKSVLLFPSYIESSPLPLSEAILHKSIIFTSDTKFSHELCKFYPNTYYFNPFDSLQLSNLMEKLISGSISYIPFNSTNIEDRQSLISLF